MRVWRWKWSASSPAQPTHHLVHPSQSLPLLPKVIGRQTLSRKVVEVVDGRDGEWTWQDWTELGAVHTTSTSTIHYLSNRYANHLSGRVEVVVVMGAVVGVGVVVVRLKMDAEQP